MHPSPAARDAVARLLARLLGVADLPRQQLLAGWAQEAAAAPAAALRFLPLPPAPRRGAAATAARRGRRASRARRLRRPRARLYQRRGVDGRRRAATTTILTAHRRRQRAIVRTAHAEAALAALAVALGSGRPTLLSGPPGCGKTALLAELARRVGQDGTGGGGGNGGGGGVVVVHLDDLSDSKTLLGSYVCAEAPGEFVWQPGVVTQAVTQGRWLLLEDVDVAPAEVMAALAPLLARNELYVPGRAQTLRAAPGFHLWATLTLQDGKRASAVGAAAAWQHVAVPPMAEADLVEIVATRCPALRAAAPQFVRRFSELAAATRARVAAAAARAAARAASAARRALESVSLALGAGRSLSSRELLRWAGRVDVAMAALGHRLPDPDGRACSSAARELVVVEGLEALVWAARRDGPRAALGGRLAELWGVPAERVRAMLDLHKPAVAREGSALRAGRVVLPLVDSGRAAAVGGGGGGYRAHSARRRASRKGGSGGAMREPLLLVGETGTGKTTAVQQLAAWVGAPLAVHNLNQQTDSTDLLGGYRPTQLRALLAPLAARFEDLFCRTFSRQKNAAFLEKLAQRLAKAEWKKLLSLMRGAARTPTSAQSRRPMPSLRRRRSRAAAAVAAAAMAARPTVVCTTSGGW